MVRNEFMNFSI